MNYLETIYNRRSEASFGNWLFTSNSTAPGLPSARTFSEPSEYRRSWPGREPVGRVLQRAGFQTDRAPLGLAAAGDEARLFENFQVFGDRRQTHRERLGELGDRGFAGDQPREDRPAGRVSERGESVAQVFHIKPIG